MSKKAENPLEPLVAKLASRLVEAVKVMPETQVPFGMKKLTREEQLGEYYRVRESPVEWHKLLEKHGMAETIRYAKEMERASAVGAQEVLDAQP